MKIHHPFWERDLGVRNSYSSKGKLRFVVIDLFAVSSEDAFLELYAREIIKASSNKWEEWINLTKKVFKTIVPKISFGVDPQSDFSLGFEWEDKVLHYN